MSLIPISDLLDCVGDKLKADTSSTGVATLVSSRIWTGIAKQQETLPFVVLNVVTDTPLSDFTNDRIDSDVQVDVYADADVGATEALAISDRIGQLLHRTTATAGSSTFTFLVTGSSRLDFEQDAYRVMTTVHAWSL